MLGYLILFSLLSIGYIHLKKENIEVEEKFSTVVSDIECQKLQLSQIHIDCDKKPITKKVSDYYIYIVLAFILGVILFGWLFYLLALTVINPIREAKTRTNETIDGIIHDINTPISTLKLNLDMLKYKAPHIFEYTETKRIIQSLDTILKYNETMRNRLHFQISFETEPIELKQWLTKRYSQYFKHKHLKFEIIGESFTVISDTLALGRIMDNIVDNAFKYTKIGSVTIELDSPYIRVVDTGVGIKHTEKIFQGHYTEQPQGLGVGLHSALLLAQTLQITIDVQSKVDQGSTFSLKFE